MGPALLEKEPAAAYVAAHQPPSHGPEWIIDLRKRAHLRFSASGFPNPRLDKWKTIDLKPLTSTPFAPAPDGARVPLSLDDLHRFRYEGLARIVMVDGVFRPDLSDLEQLPGGVDLATLPTEAARQLLGTGSTTSDDPFLDLNTMAFQDGIFTEIASDAAVDAALHILVLSTGTPQTVCHPRILVHAGQGSESRIVEQHASLHAGAAWSNAVTEVVADPGAHVDHVLIVDPAPDAMHTHHMAVRAERDAHVRQVNLCLGGSTVRNNVYAALVGQGSTATLHGLFVTADRQRVDNWTHIDHAVAHTSSLEIYKGILDDESRGAFTGNILVRQDAQKIDSVQENRNLLLSRKALVETTPQLEIHADDVKCSHGSTVGRLDEDALFFLRARGIGKKEAHVMLTKAFAGEVTGAIRVPEVRRAIEAWMEAWFDRSHNGGGAA